MNTKYMFMPVNYVSDNTGATIAEWIRIKNKYPDVDDDFDNQLPGWQKELIDTRLRLIEEHPERLKPVEELFDELDNEE